MRANLPLPPPSSTTLACNATGHRGQCSRVLGEEYVCLCADRFGASKSVCAEDEGAVKHSYLNRGVGIAAPSRDPISIHTSTRATTAHRLAMTQRSDGYDSQRHAVVIPRPRRWRAFQLEAHQRLQVCMCYTQANIHVRLYADSRPAPSRVGDARPRRPSSMALPPPMVLITPKQQERRGLARESGAAVKSNHCRETAFHPPALATWLDESILLSLLDSSTSFAPRPVADPSRVWDAPPHRRRSIAARRREQQPGRRTKDAFFGPFPQ